jgi:protein gp37
MGQDSQIQWTENSWNPWTGCRKVSAGCKFCYMYRDKDRYGQDPTQVLRSKTRFNEPLKWKDPKLIFTCSWSDWFIEEADAWRPEAWAIIKATPQHTYQILTKRPERIKDCLPPDWGTGYPNVWLGTSVENQTAANVRIPHLLKVPAAVHFLSMEPLLGAVNLMELFRFNVETNALSGWQSYHTSEGIGASGQTNKIDWVIIGGESGNDTGKWLYRECKPEWIEDILVQCRLWAVPVFVKQLGTHLAKKLKLSDRHGGTLTQWPEPFQIRQFPKGYEHEQYPTLPRDRGLPEKHFHRRRGD